MSNMCHYCIMLDVYGPLIVSEINIYLLTYFTRMYPETRFNPEIVAPHMAVF